MPRAGAIRIWSSWAPRERFEPAGARSPTRLGRLGYPVDIQGQAMRIRILIAGAVVDTLVVPIYGRTHSPMEQAIGTPLMEGRGAFICNASLPAGVLSAGE